MSHVTRHASRISMASMHASCVLCLVTYMAGCATTPKSAPVKPVETVDQQLEAARKVVGGMANRDLSREELIKFGQGLNRDPEAKTAVQKIVAPSAAPVIKYSPVTGKHYSGDLEYDPETGVKLEVAP